MSVEIPSELPPDLREALQGFDPDIDDCELIGQGLVD